MTMQASSRAVARIGGAALLALLVLSGPAVADDPVNTGLFGGVAIKGYDTVAYFTEGKAMKGSEEFAHEWLGTPWYFANAKHRDMFAADPASYAPQYGGYCTLGVGLDGHAAENIDPETAWRIIEGKLYFVYDSTYVEELDGPARDEWLASAEANWPGVKAKIEQQGFN
jgi:YHS domain-containing protein